MDSLIQIAIVFASCLFFVQISVWIIILYFMYRNNVKRLNVSTEDSHLIKPDKVRFAFSWFVISIIIYIPGVLILWLIQKNFPFVFACLMLFFLLSFAPSFYPYYIIVIYDNKINGATKWGWRWKRIDIKINEIDQEKLSQQHLGKKLGITVIRSTSGAEILTLGLSEQQLAEIIAHPSDR